VTHYAHKTGGIPLKTGNAEGISVHYNDQ